MLTLNQKINKIKDDISFINKLELDVCGNAYFRKNLIVDNSLIVQDLDIYEKLIDLSNNGMSGIFEPSGNTYYYDSTPIGIGTSDVNENFSLTISGGLYLSGNNSSSMNYTDTSWLRDASDNVYITHVNTLGIGVKYNDLSFNNKLDVSGNSYFRNNLIVDNSLIVQDLDIYEKLIDLSNNGGGDVTQQELATKQDVLTAGTNITIVGNTISSAGSALPADVNFSSVNTSTLNTSTINTNGRVDIGNSDAQSEGLVITGTKPTITFKDTINRSGMIHMNGGNMFFLSGGANSEVWTQVNGEWPLILNTDTNVAQFGGIISAPNQVSFKATTNVALRTINNNVIPDFENVVYNIGGGYDNTTYKFTAPVAGKYFLGVIFYTNEENKFTLDLLLNNTTLLTRAKRQFAVTEGGYTTFEIICFHNLNVGDVVYSKVTQSSSIAINAGGSNGFFGFLIS